MFNLHVIDYLILKRERPFLYVDKIDLTVMEIDQVSNPMLRWRTYSEHKLLEYSATNMRAKYMLDDKYISAYDIRKTAYQKLRTDLEECDSKFF